MKVFFKRLLGRKSKVQTDAAITFILERRIAMPTKLYRQYHKVFTSSYSENLQYEHFLVGITKEKRLFVAMGNGGYFNYLVVTKPALEYSIHRHTDIKICQIGEFFCIYVDGKMVGKKQKRFAAIGEMIVYSKTRSTSPEMTSVFGGSVIEETKLTTGLSVSFFD